MERPNRQSAGIRKKINVSDSDMSGPHLLSKSSLGGLDGLSHLWDECLR